MSNYEAMLFWWGILGASFVQLFLYFIMRQRNRRFDFFRACLITISSGLGCLAYFTFVDSKPATFLLALHYGIFLAFVIHYGLGLFDWALDHREENVSSVNQKHGGTATYAIAGMTLFLVGCSKSITGNIITFQGFLTTFGGGAIGALGTEIMYLRHKHEKTKLDSTDYWLSLATIIWSAALIVALHGDVSVLTAIQLGTTFTLGKSVLVDLPNKKKEE